MTTPAKGRFFGMMSVVIGVAALIWLVLALLNVRQGGSFNWIGLVIFVILAGIFTARQRGHRSR